MIRETRQELPPPPQTVLVNALSVTNQSGLHGLAGLISEARTALAGRVRFTLLAGANLPTLRDRFGDSVDWISAPPSTRRWCLRWIWESVHLPRVTRDCGATLLFSPSGLAAPRVRIPQVVLCQNPWAFVSAARRWREAPKAWLQRMGYAHAVRRADALVFLSSYMRVEYRRNARRNERQGVVVPYGIEDATWDRVHAWQQQPRTAGQILCVSAMAPHKNVETLVQALDLLVRERRVGATLKLVGSWPDSRYERRIRALVSASGLGDRVQFVGFVSREELDRWYATSQVFCLPSRCESFGIPAIEAQAFGTPVVSSTVCAIPEVCGDGGILRAPEDVPGIAEALHKLLAHPSVWEHYSELARTNARRYTWERCAQPFIRLLEDLLNLDRDAEKAAP